MKLKTLKDIDCHDAISIFEFRNNLRQEAIKWIKEEIKIALKDCNEPYNEKNIKWIIITNSERIKSWMDRFNIIEEDLKEKRDKIL